MPKKDFENETRGTDFSVPLHIGENRRPCGGKLYIGVTPPADLTEAAQFSAHIRLPEASRALFMRELAAKARATARAA